MEIMLCTLCNGAKWSTKDELEYCCLLLFFVCVFVVCLYLSFFLSFSNNYKNYTLSIYPMCPEFSPRVNISNRAIIYNEYIIVTQLIRKKMIIIIADWLLRRIFIRTFFDRLNRLASVRLANPLNPLFNLMFKQFDLKSNHLF